MVGVKQQEKVPERIDMNTSFLGKALFIDFLRLLTYVRRIIIEKGKLLINLMPLLDEDERTEVQVRKFESEMLKETKNGVKSLDNWGLFRIFMGVFGKKLFVQFLLVFLFFQLKVVNSYLINEFLDSVQGGDSKKSYFLCGMIGLVLLAGNTFFHQSNRFSYSTFSQFKATFMTVLYFKISKLTKFAMQQANIGKLVNMISADLNQLDFRFFIMIAFFSVGFTMISTCILLVYRFGWYGLIGPAVMIIFWVPNVFLIRKQQSYLIQRIPVTDKRVKLSNETVEGVRLIKIYAWEKIFTRLNQALRLEEAQYYFNMFLSQSFQNAIMYSTPLFAAFLTFVIIAKYTEIELTAGNMFSTVEIFSFFRIYINMFTCFGYQSILELSVVFDRMRGVLEIKEVQMTQLPPTQSIQKELEQPNQNQKEKENLKEKEKENQKIEVVVKDKVFQRKGVNENHLIQGIKGDFFENEGEFGSVLALRDFTGYWDKEKGAVLEKINLEVRRGDLVGICGRVGSGKSSLLLAIIGELPFYKGGFSLEGKYAYVEQEPFIFSDSLKQNILMGKEYKKDLYEKVIEVCQLKRDIEEMVDGENQEIGEKGINLSGGQKARIALARALYQESDLYLLDDPLSAVDSKVARLIYSEAIQGFLKDKGVILITHQIHFIQNLEMLYEMEGGKLHKVVDKKEVIQHIEKEEDLEEEEKVEEQLKEKKRQAAGLFTKEEDENVQVTRQTFFAYIKSGIRWDLAICLTILLIGTEIIFIFFNSTISSYKQGQVHLIYRLGYLTIGYFFAVLAKSVIMQTLFLKCNTKLYEKLIFSVLRSPILFFDQTPTGRIINRFSNDVSILDNVIIQIFQDVLDLSFMNAVLMVTVVINTPILLVIIFVLLVFLFSFLSYAKPVLSHCRTLDLRHKSPLITTLSTTISGILSLRVFNQINSYYQKFVSYADQSLQATWIFYFVTRVFGAYIQNISTIILLAGLFIMLAIDQGSTTIGQTIIYSIIMVDSLQWLFRQIIQLEVFMGSTQRCINYIENKLEDELEKDVSIPKFENIQFNQVFLRYREGTQLALKGLTFEVQKGQRVGIVGRTGAGKSSILQALFRMTELESGNIKINGVDIKTVGLHNLRKGISIIPQIPFTFTGSVRKNLDPIGTIKDDAKIWEILRLLELDKVVEKLESKLDQDISNIGSVFSTGQQQLICLGRVLLQPSSILVLDEATAFVDRKTDNQIQSILKQKFHDTTIITIAHRLNTIADYDQIIVMDDGKVFQSGHPYELLTEPEQRNQMKITSNSLFAQMVQNTGIHNSEEILKISHQAYFQKKK